MQDITRHLGISGVPQEVRLVDEDGIELVVFHELFEFKTPGPERVGIPEGDLQRINN